MIIGILLIILGILTLLLFTLKDKKEINLSPNNKQQEFKLVFKPWYISDDFCEIHYYYNGKTKPILDLKHPILRTDVYEIETLIYKIPFTKEYVQKQFKTIEDCINHNNKIKKECDEKNKELIEYKNKIKQQKRDFYNN